MSSVSSMISKFGGANSVGGPSLYDQFGKHKAPVSPTFSKSSFGLKKSKSLLASFDKEASTHDESLRSEDDFFVAKDESDLDKFRKSAPTGKGALEKETNTKRAPDPSGSVTSRSIKASKSPKTVRKTAIKASDLGIDLKNISNETLNQAVKKWKADQKSGSDKPDPAGEDATKSRGRSKNRSKSYERDNDTTPTRSTRVRSKSRSKDKKEGHPSLKKSASSSTPRTVKKIIVRRRASLMDPESEPLRRAAPTRQVSKDDMSDLLQSRLSEPNLSTESVGKSSEAMKSPQSVSAKSDTSSEKASCGASPEECVDTVLQQVQLSPQRFTRRTELLRPDEVQKQRSSSRGRMAKARADVAEIQKRLKAAGITDEQYKAMLSAGLTISLV